MAGDARRFARVLRAHVRAAGGDARAAQREARLIEAEPVPRCLLCGGEGELRYRDLEDRLFGAPGRWSFRRCPVDGLWWLDPRPTVASLPVVYARYCTHDDSALRRSLAGRIWLALGSVVRHAPLAALRDIGAAELMWLDRRKPGRLLDVGAGDGRLLAAMRGRGWRVLGVEPDPAAVRRARARGVEMIEGGVDAVPGDARFDAVTLNNVIEHARDPIAMLVRCWSLLDRGGELVVLTPNVAGLGHRMFGARWRGLEVPRHLYLFTLETLGASAERAGVPARRWTTARAAPFIWSSSGGSVLGGGIALARESLSPSLGEKVLLRARQT